MSFGHAAFVGIGAYAVGDLRRAWHHRYALISLPVALVGQRAVCLLTGIVCLRTKSVYFIMITLAFGQMVYFIAGSLAPYGGDDGLTIQLRSTLLGFPILQNDRALYYAVLAFLLGVVSAAAARSSPRASAACFAAHAKTRRAWRPSASTCSAIQLVAYVIAGASAGCRASCSANATDSSARPTCRGSAPAN